MPSGSENRKRQMRIFVRCTEEERRLIDGQAERLGLHAASYLRALALGAPGPRTPRRPSINDKTYAQAYAQLQRLGNNLNQLARVANTTGQIRRIPALRLACDAFQSITIELREALGLDDGGPPDAR